MNKEDIKNKKIKYILYNISNDYLEFLKQTKRKLRYNKKILNLNMDLNPDELLSDVIYSIVSKLDDETKLKRFHVMAVENKLRLYIFKSIDINCRSFKAPYLQSKINKKRIAFYNRDDMSHIGSIDLEHEPMDSDTKKLSEMSLEKQHLVKEVYKLLEPGPAKELFGPHWKYFVQIFHDYMDNPKGTYKSISLKYNIPLSSIQNHLQIVYKKIRNKIDEKNKQIT